MYFLFQAFTICLVLGGSLHLRDKAVGDGVEGEAGGGFDAQLGGDVFAVGEDGVDADVEAGGDLFVCQALDDEAEDIFLAFGEAVAFVVDHGQEDAMPDAVVLADVAAEGVDGEEDGVAEVLVVWACEVLEHDVAHVVEGRLDGFVVVGGGVGACPAAVSLRVSSCGKEVGEPVSFVGFDAAAEALLEGGEHVSQEAQ